MRSEGEEVRIKMIIVVEKALCVADDDDIGEESRTAQILINPN